ncbi:MAG: 3-phosphoglycerate dehydrogenase [Bacteroidetes bacterium]|nr:3-phosphoglycerate dehydrogenase [Bacteroidota bacterium]
MKNILVNDSFHPCGISLLKTKGFNVFEGSYNGQELINFINSKSIGILLIRSATQVNKEVIDACPTLKFVGRGGVGMDNIDEVAAKKKGIITFNTPGASTTAVAELVFAHLLSIYRFVSTSNKLISENPDSVKRLKKELANGRELKGKTLGVWGTGRIGCEVMKIAISFGMEVIAYHPTLDEVEFTLEFFDTALDLRIPISPLDEFLAQADIISLHIPLNDSPVITKDIISKMKKGVTFINTSRSGNVDEVALLEALNSGKIAHAALDVFNGNTELLQHPNISLTPHLGASTIEAQEKISDELAKKIISLVKNQ